MGGGRRGGFKRRRPCVEPEPALLIVTEGEKTEPKYLEALRRKLHLVATRVEIVSAEGTDPRSVIEYAIQQRDRRRAAAKRGNGVEYEAAWAVFDSEQRLGRPELLDALQLARARSVLVAMSSPCFEFWLILHYEYTTQYMCSYVEAANRLQRHVAAYDKANPPVDDLLTRVADAAANASRCRVAQDEVGAELPRTDVDLLVISMNCAARKHQRVMECPSGADKAPT